MNQKTKRIWMVVALAARAAFVARVAGNLGIDESKLTAAIETAREQTIDEALAAGQITAEQAAARKERLALSAERAMKELIAGGPTSGKISQEQADLIAVRLGSSMMGRRGFTRSLPDSCVGRIGRGMGR